MVNWKLIVIGSILTAMISTILALILIVLEFRAEIVLWDAIGVFLATIYVGYAVGRDYATDGQYGMIVGIIGGMIGLSIMWTIYGGVLSQLIAVMSISILFGIIYGVLGAIGGIIGGFIIKWKSSKEEKIESQSD